MDSFDKALLRLVQQDNRQTHEVLGEKVGLSPSAVRRRLKILRDSGIIARDVSILDLDRTGFTVIVMVRCETESAEVYNRFKARMKSCERVLQCYSTSGEHDFIVVAHMEDMPAYNTWLQEYVIGDAGLNRCDTAFAFETIKYETAVIVD